MANINFNVFTLPAQKPTRQPGMLTCADCRTAVKHPCVVQKNGLITSKQCQFP
jgi:hypothetical protein